MKPALFLLAAALCGAAPLYTTSGHITPCAEGECFALFNQPGRVQTATITFEQPVDWVLFEMDTLAEGVGTGVCVNGDCRGRGERLAGAQEWVLAASLTSLELTTTEARGFLRSEHGWLRVLGAGCDGCGVVVQAVPEPSGWRLFLVAAWIGLGVWAYRLMRAEEKRPWTNADRAIGVFLAAAFWYVAIVVIGVIRLVRLDYWSRPAKW